MWNFRESYRWLTLISAVAIVLTASRLDVRGDRRVGIAGTDILVPELCSFHTVTGLDCPGCGLTRSFVCMVRGDIRSAGRYHPIGVVLFVLLLLQIPWQGLQLYRLRRGKAAWQLPHLKGRMGLALFAVALAVYLVFGIGRIIWTLAAS